MSSEEIIEYEGRRFVRTGEVRILKTGDIYECISCCIPPTISTAKGDAIGLKGRILRELPAETPAPTPATAYKGQDQIQFERLAWARSICSQCANGIRPLVRHKHEWMHHVSGNSGYFKCSAAHVWDRGEYKFPAELLKMADEIREKEQLVNSNAGLLAEAEEALRCVWAGVPDGVRRSLAAGADDLRSNSIVVIPVLPEVLRKVESVLARIQAARQVKP